MVRSFRQQGNPPWRLPQRSRPAGVHRNVSESLEQKSQTLRVDRDRRIHSRKAHSLSPEFGEEEAMTAYLFSRHYTRLRLKPEGSGRMISSKISGQTPTSAHGAKVV